MAENNVDKITKHQLASSWFSTVMSITLVLYMVGLLGVILINTQNIIKETKENISFEVMLSMDMKEGEIMEFKKQLEAEPYVRSIRYVSKEDAINETIEFIGHDFRDVVINEIIPTSFVLKIKSEYTSLDSLQKIEKQLQLQPNVRDFAYQRSYVENINQNLSKISLVMLIISLVLLIIAISLINNTIRLSIYSKRFIIKSMLLVGATRWKIHKPFIYKGIMQGLWGGIFAILLLSGTIYLVYSNYPDFVSLENPELYAALFVVVMLIGLFFTWLSTSFAVRKYIKMKIDKLYF